MGADKLQQEKALPQKSYHTILKQEIIAGLTEVKRPALGLFLSSLSAGLDIGFSLLLMATMLTMVTDIFSNPVIHIFIANLYSIGFILVILGRSELFTEHTTLAVLPVLDGRASLRDLVRVWLLVFGGNITGAVIFTFLISWIGPVFGIIEPWAFGKIAHSLVDHQWWVILISAILAGWLMGELGWLVAAGRDTISQLLFVWIVTTAIGFIGLHHSIAGTVEVLAGVLTNADLTFGDFIYFIVWSTIGNAIGGVIFVAVIKYGHASQTMDGDICN